MPAVQADRQRLSVGFVETDSADLDTAAVVEDKDAGGLIAALSEKTIVELAAKGDNNSRSSVASVGSSTDQGRSAFACKTMQQLGDALDPREHGLGYTCRKGLKPEAPNQDSWTILKLESHAIYAVFDGHGKCGHDVSNFVKENLPKLIIKDQRFKTREMPDMLKDVFQQTQLLVRTADQMKKVSAQLAGTTATVCIHDYTTELGGDHGKLTIAHVADSTAVLGKLKQGPKREIVAEQLTRDHKPNLKDERARIEKAGGRVVFDGHANHRVYAKKARYPGLGMSRALGDLLGHDECGLSAEPEVMERILTADDLYLLLCSDGVWEFTSPSEAVGLVSGHPSKNSMQAAECLAKEAWDRWIREEGGAVVDDITVLLVYLRPNGIGDHVS